VPSVFIPISSLPHLTSLSFILFSGVARKDYIAYE
jgi:hypothetical protein